LTDQAPTPVSKPIPEPDDASRPFFEGALLGRLMLMRCDDCGTLRLPSRMHCDVCLSANTSWTEASGRGTVRSFCIMHQRYHAAFEPEIPYNIAVVELEEGPRIVTNLRGIDNHDIRVGMPVVVHWEHYPDLNAAMPKFRPA
jgi:uncharacterized OB-fold protein